MQATRISEPMILILGTGTLPLSRLCPTTTLNWRWSSVSWSLRCSTDRWGELTSLWLRWLLMLTRGERRLHTLLSVCLLTLALSPGLTAWATVTTRSTPTSTVGIDLGAWAGQRPRNRKYFYFLEQNISGTIKYFINIIFILKSSHIRRIPTISQINVGTNFVNRISMLGNTPITGPEFQHSPRGQARNSLFFLNKIWSRWDAAK